MGMANRTHYQVLGVRRNFTSVELRSAYRRMALIHHPDRSKASDAVDRFIEVVKAYEVLNDPLRRESYDRLLAIELGQAAVRAGPFAEPRRAATGARSSSRARGATATHTAPDLDRLTTLFGRGRFVEAERLARTMIEAHPRLAVPYAVLGDVLRSRGDLPAAAKQYAYAYQMEPRNPVYAKRHEELMRQMARTSGAVANARNPVGALAVSLVGVILVAVYLAMSREPALAPSLPLVSTWTLSAVMGTFLAGLIVGASMAQASLLDRFQAATSATAGRPSPTVALAFVAVVNFWAAVLMYVAIGQTQKAYQYSTSRVVCATAAATILLSLAVALGGTVDGWQVFAWGGNLCYMGGLCGWMVADSLQR